MDIELSELGMVSVVHGNCNFKTCLFTKKAVSFEVILHESFVSRIKCTDCQSTYIGETGRNLKTRLTVISGITFLNTID